MYTGFSFELDFESKWCKKNFNDIEKIKINILELEDFIRKNDFKKINDYFYFSCKSDSVITLQFINKLYEKFPWFKKISEKLLFYRIDEMCYINKENKNDN